MKKTIFILSLSFFSFLAFAFPSLGPKNHVKVPVKESLAGSVDLNFECADCYKHYKANLSSPTQKTEEDRVSDFLGTSGRQRKNTRSIRDN